MQGAHRDSDGANLPQRQHGSFHQTRPTTVPAAPALATASRAQYRGRAERITAVSNRIYSLRQRQLGWQPALDDSFKRSKSISVMSPAEKREVRAAVISLELKQRRDAAVADGAEIPPDSPFTRAKQTSVRSPSISASARRPWNARPVTPPASFRRAFPGTPRSGPSPVAAAVEGKPATSVDGSPDIDVADAVLQQRDERSMPDACTTAVPSVDMGRMAVANRRSLSAGASYRASARNTLAPGLRHHRIEHDNDDLDESPRLNVGDDRDYTRPGPAGRLDFDRVARHSELDTPRTPVRSSMALEATAVAAPEQREVLLLDDLVASAATSRAENKEAPDCGSADGAEDPVVLSRVTSHTGPQSPHYHRAAAAAGSSQDAASQPEAAAAAAGSSQDAASQPHENRSSVLNARETGDVGVQAVVVVASHECSMFTDDDRDADVQVRQKPVRKWWQLSCVACE